MIPPKVTMALAITVLPAGIWHAVRGEADGSERPVPAQDEERVFHEQFEVGAEGALSVDLPDGDVEVLVGDAGTVEIEVVLRARDLEWGREVFRRMEFRAEHRGNTVRIDGRDPRIERDEWGRNRGVGVLTRVTVPVAIDVDILTSDGDITVDRITGEVALRSRDGDITVGEVSGTNVELETADGDVMADVIVADQMSIRTLDGDIVLREASGNISATTNDGDIRVELARVTGVDLTTHDGDITVYAPAALEADVMLQGEDMAVDRGFDMTGDISRRRIRGTINGGGARLSASTHDGDVALRVRR